LRCIMVCAAALLLIACVVSGCTPIAQQTNISTPIGRSLTAGVGDVILRSESRESLPNVFGQADLFGRTRPAGFATIQFAGMQDGKVVLLRSGVITQSDATTMNSTGLLVSTRESTVYVPPSGSTQTSAAQPTIPIIVDWKTAPAVPALGKTIVIESASPTALIYRIEGP
jgi:hypothetical protein